MLPKTIPVHRKVEINVLMTTASEIGGDYYDFYKDENEAITFAIGDATGHGAKASAMVTAVKVLFCNNAGKDDLVKFLENTSISIKQMSLPSLYMAMAVGRINSNYMELAGAGMPPALVYSAATGKIEKISLSGLPLGSYIKKFYYKKQTAYLSPNDTIVFMTDGFSELFNSEGEILGDDRIIKAFHEVANKSTIEILNHFEKVKSLWSKDIQQKDDITF